jgi:hypothetical protein
MRPSQLADPNLPSCSNRPDREIRFSSGVLIDWYAACLRHLIDIADDLNRRGMRYGSLTESIDTTTTPSGAVHVQHPRAPSTLYRHLPGGRSGIEQMAT